MKKIYSIEDYKLDKFCNSVKSFYDDEDISAELKRPILVAYKEFIESLPCKSKKRRDLINRIIDFEKKVI